MERVMEKVNKSVIYIDAEDDITDIIGKIKAARENTVAVVPPKRVGALQSIVNLKLLARTAKNAKKDVILVTNSPAVVPMAALAGLPVSKSLNGKAEIAELPKKRDDKADDDVIEGAETTRRGTGVLAKSSDADPGDISPRTKIPIAAGLAAPGGEEEDIIEEIVPENDEEFDGDDPEKARKKSEKNKKVPNFSKFRKRMIIGVVAGVLVIAFVVWALVFAPAATIIVKANVTKDDISENSISIATEADKAKPEDGVFLAEKQEIKKMSEYEFEPTGEKTVGEKAKGEVTLVHKTCNGLTVKADIDSCMARISFPAGTVFVNDVNGLEFVSIAAAELPAMEDTTKPTTVTIPVEATSIGAEHNVAAASYSPTIGMSQLSASNGSAMTGGSSKTIKVVSQTDYDDAKAMLSAANEGDGKQELLNSFNRDILPVKASFRAVPGDVKVDPVVGAEVADGKRAKMTQETVFWGYGVKRSDVKVFVDSKLAAVLETQPDQKIYDDGVNAAYIDSYLGGDGNLAGKINVTYKIGPKISEEDVKEKSLGLKVGDVQRNLQSIKGVQNVEVDFSYFWVSKVPKDESKVKIEIDISE